MPFAQSIELNQLDPAASNRIEDVRRLLSVLLGLTIWFENDNSLENIETNTTYSIGTTNTSSLSLLIHKARTIVSSNITNIVDLFPMISSSQKCTSLPVCNSPGPVFITHRKQYVNKNHSMRKHATTHPLLVVESHNDDNRLHFQQNINDLTEMVNILFKHPPPLSDACLLFGAVLLCIQIWDSLRLIQSDTTYPVSIEYYTELSNNVDVLTWKLELVVQSISLSITHSLWKNNKESLNPSISESSQLSDEIFMSNGTYSLSSAPQLKKNEKKKKKPQNFKTVKHKGYFESENTTEKLGVIYPLTQYHDRYQESTTCEQDIQDDVQLNTDQRIIDSCPLLDHQMYLSTVSMPEWVPVWDVTFEQELRQSNILEVERIQQSLRDLKDLSKELAIHSAESVERVQIMASSLDETNQSTRRAVVELAEASKTQTGWWKLTGSGAGLIGGSLLTVGLGPVGFLAGASLGGAMGLAAGRSAKRHHREKMNRVIEQMLETGTNRHTIQE